jgi:hypothetical protein
MNDGIRAVIGGRPQQQPPIGQIPLEKNRLGMNR